MRQQRDIIYEQRKEVLESDSLREIIEGMIRSTVERNVHAYTQDEDDENWDLEALAEFLQANVLNQDEVSVDDLKGKEPEEIIEWVIEKTQEKKSSYCVRLTANGWITSTRWTNYAKEFICVHTVKTIHCRNTKWKASRCLKR